MSGHILFLDIETVPVVKEFSDLSENLKIIWEEKSIKFKEENSPSDSFFNKSGVLAEFAKIVCISVGYFHSGSNKFRLKTYAEHDEKSLLINFSKLLEKSFNNSNKHFLCAHNGIEFDFPFIARRLIIHGLELPKLLDIGGTKSWNNPFLLDTMDYWKFGDIKNYTSLNLLAACLGVPSPKDDISGKDVARVYYTENDLARIAKYCGKDVVTIGRIFLKLMGAQSFPDSDVELID